MSIAEKPRKRRLEVDEDDNYGEGDDTFDLDDAGGPRRGRKDRRRVSGVYKNREIPSLQSNGGTPSVMELVFEKLSMKNVMMAGCSSIMWNVMACHELRKRYHDSPILRLWTSNKPPQYPDMNWELHLHEQILAGTEDEHQDQNGTNSSRKIKQFPPVDSIISIGSRYTFDQFSYEEAKLPLQQDHIFVTSADAIITAPDFSYTGTVEEKFGLDMVIQSFLIPKSRHISVKAFALGSNCNVEQESETHEPWTADQVKAKVELPVEDVGEGLELRAVLCVHYHPKGPTIGFVDTFKLLYKNVGLLSGFAEEIGCNRFSAYGSPWAVGLSIYAGPDATVSVYQIDFEGKNSEDVLIIVRLGNASRFVSKMEEQAKSFRHGFCFVFSHDSRPAIEIIDDDANEDWSSSYSPPSKVGEIINNLRTRMPKIPLFGVNSGECSTAFAINPKNSNVNENSRKELCYGFLMVTYK